MLTVSHNHSVSSAVSQSVSIHNEALRCDFPFIIFPPALSIQLSVTQYLDQNGEPELGDSGDWLLTSKLTTSENE